VAVLIPHDPIRGTLHALTRSAVYGMFVGLLAPPADGLALANQFEQAHNLAGAVPARLPFNWSTATLLAAVALARGLDPGTLMRQRQARFGGDGGTPDAALIGSEPDGDALDTLRVARTYERWGFRPLPGFAAGHLAQQLAFVRHLAEREADAEGADARIDCRRAQSAFIELHPAPLCEALARDAAPQAARCPFAGVLLALAQWLQRDCRWLGDSAGTAAAPA
jgi:TorA maturation chaperone TorD